MSLSGLWFDLTHPLYRSALRFSAHSDAGMGAVVPIGSAHNRRKVQAINDGAAPAGCTGRKFGYQ